MRKMLEELYYGNINPNEREFIRNTDFDRAMRILSENVDKLTELLDGKEKKLFLDLVNTQSSVVISDCFTALSLLAIISAPNIGQEPAPLPNVRPVAAIAQEGRVIPPVELNPAPAGEKTANIKPHNTPPTEIDFEHPKPNGSPAIFRHPKSL
ncbi:hypothetical protein D3C76_1437170 [compost metagenome]